MGANGIGYPQPLQKTPLITKVKNGKIVTPICLSGFKNRSPRKHKIVALRGKYDTLYGSKRQEGLREKLVQLSLRFLLRENRIGT